MFSYKTTPFHRIDSYWCSKGGFSINFENWGGKIVAIYALVSKRFFDNFIWVKLLTFSMSARPLPSPTLGPPPACHRSLARNCKSASSPLYALIIVISYSLSHPLRQIQRQIQLQLHNQIHTKTHIHIYTFTQVSPYMQIHV